ncbi:MAG: DUF6353 family protein [Anaeroplasma sp.]
MGKFNLNEVISKIKFSTSKHAPQILVGVGIAGMATATVLAVKSTPKALQLMEEKKDEENKEKLEPLEVVKTTWKCYIPTAALMVLSTGCLIGSCSISTKRYAALAAAYKIAETGYNEYRDKVIETIGEEKEKEIKSKVAESRIEKTPAKREDAIITGHGDTLCYDNLSGRYFRSSPCEIKNAQNVLNSRMYNYNEMYVSLNDFYDEVGLERTKMGDRLGWNISSGLVELELSSTLSKNDEPVLVVDFINTPKEKYYSSY